jgi:hypothetical protein
MTIDNRWTPLKKGARDDLAKAHNNKKLGSQRENFILCALLL